MEGIGLTANKSSSAGVEGRSDLGVVEVGGVWRRWNQKILRLREGVDGGDEDGERQESSTHGEGPASSRDGERPRRRRRPRAVPRGG
jgi:hypothetical protein